MKVTVNGSEWQWFHDGQWNSGSGAYLHAGNTPAAHLTTEQMNQMADYAAHVAPGDPGSVEGYLQSLDHYDVLGHTLQMKAAALHLFWTCNDFSTMGKALYVLFGGGQ